MAGKDHSTFDNWIFNSFEVYPQGLALYRIFSALFILFYLVPSPELYHFIGNLPADFFTPPPGPMMLFDGWPPEYIFWGLHGLLITALIFLCLGCFTQIASISVGVLLLALYGFIYSTGKVNHDILIVVMPVVMAFSGWGSAYSVDYFRSSRQPAASQSWPLVLLALIIGFMMFTAGFPKILGGWLDMGSQATQGHYLKHFFVRGRQDLLASYAQHIGSWGWEIFDYVTVLFEVGFLAAVVHPRSTRIFIALAVLFHFGTMLILNISFLPNFLAYAAFINWADVNRVLKKQATSYISFINRWIAPVAVALCMAVLYALVWISGQWYPHILQSDWGTAGVVIVCCAVPVAVVYLLHEIEDVVR